MPDGQTVLVPQLPAAKIAASRALDHSLVRGIAWTGGVKWLSQILSWASTILVARLLLPDDYGLVAMASAFIGLVTLINEFGIGTAIIMLRELSEEQVAQINSLAVLLGVVGFSLCCAVAVPLSRFYRVTDLVLVVVAMGAGFVIGAFRTVPNALLEKELRFKLLASLEGVQALVLTLTVVMLALLGLGYWALVLSGLLGTTVATALALTWRPHRFAWPNIRSLQKAVILSWHIIVSRVCWYISVNSDAVIVGRFLGQAALGSYSVGLTLANVPLDKITTMVNRVTPAIYSAVQTDFAGLRRYLLILTEGLALVTFPVAFGLALVAHDFVLLALGKQWEAAIAPLQLLACYASIRSVGTLLGQILIVTGESRFAMLVGFWMAALFPVAFYVGSFWGIVGIASAWILAHPLVAWPVYWRVFRTIDLAPGQYLQALWPALSGTLLMATGVWLIKQVLPPEWPLPLSFGLQVLGGGTAYVLTMMILHRHRLTAFIQFLRTKPS